MQITMETDEDTQFLDAMRNAKIKGALIGVESAAECQGRSKTRPLGGEKVNHFVGSYGFGLSDLLGRLSYLLHGPPGNGKSSAITAMLAGRSLTAYTIRFFHPHTDDEDLERLFERAAKNQLPS
ncbi:MAG: hypothetical protein ACRD19_07165 [Terriglobia bacterium]